MEGAIKAIIFDCVGPLLVLRNSWRPNLVTKEINKLCGKATNENEFWLSIKKKHTLDDKEIDTIINEITSGFEKNMPMWDFINGIKKSYLLGLINNGTSTIFNKWKEKYCFAKIFDVIVNSSSLRIRKPDPRIYRFACEKLQIQPHECIFTDDSLQNVQGAEKAGMKGILYNPNTHNEFLKDIHILLKTPNYRKR